MKSITYSEHQLWLSQFMHRVGSKRDHIGLKYTLGLPDVIKRSLELTLWENKKSLAEPIFPNAKNPDCVAYVLADPAMKRQFFRYALSITMDFTYPNRLREWDAWVCAYFGDCGPIRMLDAGCSFDIKQNLSPTSEDTARALRLRGIRAEVVAVDIIVPKKMDGAKQGGVNYMRGDLFRLKSDEVGLFDCIRCLNVATHYEQEGQQVLLQTLKSLLKPGGVLIENTGSDHSAGENAGMGPMETLKTRNPKIVYEEGFLDEGHARIHFGPQA